MTTSYPADLAAGQLWTVPFGLVEDAPMLLVSDPGFSGFPWVYAVARASDLADPHLLVVDDTPLGEPLVILSTTTANVGPQAFGHLLGDLLDPSVAFSLRDLDDTELAAAGVRHASGPDDLDGVRALSKSLMAVMTHDPSRTPVPLDDLGTDVSALPDEILVDCCPGKSCGLTTVRLGAYRETDTDRVRLRYARTSNGDDYLVADTPAELAAFVAERAR